MFPAGLYRRTQARILNYARYSESKSIMPNVFLLGGGLGKLQGGIKEEEYFSSINHGLMSNIRKHVASSKDADYMRNWEEFQKILDHAAFYNTTCLNKYKDLHEEAFFLNENTECLKMMINRSKVPPNPEED